MTQHTERHTRASAAQTAYFYETLKQIAIQGDVPGGHLFKQLPEDPLSKGSSRVETNSFVEVLY